MRRLLLTWAMILVPLTAAADPARLSTWRFYEGQGTDGTPFCALDARLANALQVEKSVQIKSFSGKPHLSVDLTDIDWTIADRSQVPVVFDATAMHPISLQMAAFPQTLDLALSSYQTPDLLAAIGNGTTIRIDFPGLDIPPWTIPPGMTSVEAHKFVRCRNRQPVLRGDAVGKARF